MGKPSKQEVKFVMEDVEELGLPDSAYWMLVHERLDLDYGDVFDFIAADPEFFNAHPSGGDRHGE